MEAVEIRQARTWSEREACIQLWGSVFPEDPGYFAERLAVEADCGLDTTWVAVVGGQIVAAAQVFPYWARLGETMVRIGGIGNVATRPDYRGRGLAQAILTAQVDWMRSNGVAVSILYTGIPDFYGALGWRIAPREILVVSEPMLAALALGPRAPYEVDEYRPSDLEEVCRLYDAFNAGRPGSRIREISYARATFAQTMRRGTFLLARKGGRLVGYTRAVSGLDNTAEVRELCYAEGHEQAALCLVQQLTRRLDGLERLEISVPIDHHLWTWAGRGFASVKRVDDVMYRVVDAARLTAACQESGLSDCVTRSPGDTATLTAMLLAGAGLSRIFAGCTQKIVRNGVIGRTPILWKSDAF